MLYKASAPGSTMLLGEYAVLLGKPAVVCALNKRITVELSPRDDDVICIHSSTLGEYITSVSTLTITKPFQFVLATLKHFQPQLHCGFDITITSEFSEKIGFGSSAAVTVATLSALNSFLNRTISSLDLIQDAREIIRLVQGAGSGADIAASVMGGIIAYQSEPISVEEFDYTLPITLYFCGFKTPTPKAIEIVQTRFASHPQLFNQLIETIGQCAIDGVLALREKDTERFAYLMNTQQGLQEALGVSLPILQKMIDQLRAAPGIQAAKISGSGLGDCVVGLGRLVDNLPIPLLQTGAQLIDVEMTAKGVQCEKI